MTKNKDSIKEANKNLEYIAKRINEMPDVLKDNVEDLDVLIHNNLRSLNIKFNILIGLFLFSIILFLIKFF